MRRIGRKARFKRQRRLMTELPGLGKPGALERKPYPPGEHGQRRKKFSEYALQLEEKQKVVHHYQIREDQMRRMVKEAKRTAQINWVDQLINLMERRIDNVVFRLGFASSIRASKQLVSHGKVFVNGKRLSIRSAILDIGDRVTLSEEAYKNQTYLYSKGSPRLPLPDYLGKETEGEKEIGVLKSQPALGDFPATFDEGLFTSYYNLKG